MDLFYSNLTTEEQLIKLNGEIKTKLNIPYNWKKKKQTGFKILEGNINSFDDCMLILLPHPSRKGFLGSSADKYLLNILYDYEFKNVLVSYCYLKMTKVATKPMIQGSATEVETLISIINPKLVVLAGADAGYTFLSRKPMIEDKHGTIVGYNGDIPLILTHHPSYYISDTGYEDTRYKDHIKVQDWNFIKENYNKLIKE